MANTFRMTDSDIKKMIQLRANNETIFTGRKNSAMRGWRAIIREMGLQGLMSARQLKKKWGNLKEKYRMLKNPPQGMENLARPSSWRWFHLMDLAMSGRLDGTAKTLQPSALDEELQHTSDLAPLNPADVDGDGDGDVSVSSVVDTGTVEEAVAALRGFLEVGPGSPEEDAADGGGGGVHARGPDAQPVGLFPALLSNGNPTTDANTPPPSSRDPVRDAAELRGKLSALRDERRALEREQAEFDRELIALERDRQLLTRDGSALQRERAAVDRDRAAAARDRAFLDRDRAVLDRDRAFLERDRAFLDRARDDMERERALLRRERERDGVRGRAQEEVVLHTRFYQSLRAADLDPDQLETRQRLVTLFQRLVEKL